MGCWRSSMKQANELKNMARKRSSAWVLNEVASAYLTPEDWSNVTLVWNLARSQGIEIDIITMAFERLFIKYPKTKLMFMDSSLMQYGEEVKIDPRFQGHMREITGAIYKILEFKYSDPERLENFLREMRELHRNINGFQSSYFESFAHCLQNAFLFLMGPVVSKAQKESYRKFVLYLYRSLCKEDPPLPKDTKVFLRQLSSDRAAES